MSLPGAFWRGMGRRPMLPLCRATCPTPGTQGHQRARSAHASDAARHSFGFASAPQALPLDAGRSRSAENWPKPRSEKQGFAAAGGGQAQRRTPAGADPYSLIQGIKYGNPRQCWRSGRFGHQKGGGDDATRKRA